jgi:hypothetical protein
MSSSILKKRIVVNIADGNTDINEDNEILKATNEECDVVPKKRVYMGYQPTAKKSEDVEAKSYESMMSDLMNQDTGIYDDIYNIDNIQTEESDDSSVRTEKKEKKIWMKEGNKKEPRVGSAFQADL